MKHDPYFKPQPIYPHHDCRIDESGSINAPNFSAHSIPELNMHITVGGTLYSVSGVYVGHETLDEKLKRNLPNAIGGSV